MTITTQDQVVREFNLSQASAATRNALAAATPAFGAAKSGQTAKNTPERIAETLKAWATAVRAVRRDPLASNHVLGAAEKQLHDQAVQWLADLRRDFDRLYAEMIGKLTDPTPAPEPGQYGILWGRVERQLDAGIAPEAIIEVADADTLRVMEGELSSWRRASMPGDLRDADFLAAADLERVKVRRYELATPERRVAMDAADAAESGRYRTTVAFAQASNVLEHVNDFLPNDGGRMVVLPLWEVGKELTFYL